LTAEPDCWTWQPTESTNPTHPIVHPSIHPRPRQVVEMLMQREGTDVCCTSEADASRAARLERGRGD
jgi:hypothetical protein